MRINDAKLHLDEAMKQLTLEAYRGADVENMVRVDDFTIAEELERIDRALGSGGTTLLAAMGDNVRAAYVEIKAARKALDSGGEGQ